MAFAQIVFPERRPRHVGIFDYALPPDLSIEEGSLVVVPFRKSEKQGIVWKLQGSPSIDPQKIKPIRGLASPSPVLTKIQLKTAAWLVEQTGSSISTVLHTLLPDKPKRKSYSRFTKNLSGKNTSSQKIELVITDTQDLAETFLRQLMTDTDRTTAIVCPDNLLVQTVSHMLADVSPVTFTGKDASGKRFLAWDSAATGSASLFIGTQNVLLLPFHSLERIVVLHEQDTTYQQNDQHPDIDARALAHFIADQFGSSLTFISSSPSVDTYHLANTEGQITHLKAPRAKITIIDRTQFPKKKQSSLLPDDLIDFIQSQTRQVALIYNRKGFSRHIRCKECGWQPTCPTCQNSFLVEQSHDGVLTCAICQNVTPLPDRCPSCTSTSLISVFPGIHALESRLRPLLPQKHIQTITKETEELDKSLSADVLLITQFALPYLPWNNIGSVVVLDADLSLSTPDFRSTEWFLQRMRYVQSHLSTGATLFILTRQPESPVLNALQTANIEKWYKKELADRRQLRFPPFSAFVKLSCTMPTSEEITETESRTSASLKRKFHELSVDASVVRMHPIPEKNEVGYISLIIIKVPIKQVEKTMKVLSEPEYNTWNIEKNPLDLQTI